MTSQGSVGMEIARNRILRLDSSGVCIFARESQCLIPECSRAISTVVHGRGWRSFLLDGRPHDPASLPTLMIDNIQKRRRRPQATAAVWVWSVPCCAVLCCVVPSARRQDHHAVNVIDTQLRSIVDCRLHRPHDHFPARTSPRPVGSSGQLTVALVSTPISSIPQTSKS